MELGYHGTGHCRCSSCVHCRAVDTTLTTSRSGHCRVKSDSVHRQCHKLPVMSFTLQFSILLLLFGYSYSMAVPANHYKEMQATAVTYLSRFRYLSGPSQETGNLMSQEDLTSAIKKFQRIGRIPETGRVDHRTLELMQKPRCGNSDENLLDLKRRRRKRYTLAPTKWQKKNLTFRMINYTPDMSPQQVQRVVHSAFNVWSKATRLTFREVMHGPADILIQFASRYHQDGYPFDGKGMILAHAFFPGDGKGGDTHFDDDEHWTYNSTDGVDLFMVAAHEFGHALGLAHSSRPGALMYPWYQGFQKKFELPLDDIQGIQELYGYVKYDLPKYDIPDKPVTVIPQDPDRKDPVEKDPDVSPDPDTPYVNDSKPADPCKHAIDAITVLRQEVCVFIGRYFWRLDSRHILQDPVNIHQFWYGLPTHLDHIDAIYERPNDGKIVFFAGDKHWVFNANYIEPGYPKEGRPLTDFGIPSDVKKIDTVFVWGFNRRTYLVSGDMYWKLDENNTYVEYDYPRDMSIWRGIPVPVDAAFKYWDGKTYFFKGRNFYEFYDIKMRARRGNPKLIAKEWLKCSAGIEIKHEPHRSSAPSLTRHVISVFTCLFLLRYFIPH